MQEFDVPTRHNIFDLADRAGISVTALAEVLHINRARIVRLRQGQGKFTFHQLYFVAKIEKIIQHALDKGQFPGVPDGKPISNMQMGVNKRKLLRAAEQIKLFG